MERQASGETAPLRNLFASDMLGVEALVRVLIRKGIVTEEELLDELRAVRSERPETQEGLSEFEKGP